MSCKTARLRTRLVWRCPECGKVNICKAVVAELSEEDKIELQEAGILEPATGMFSRVPDDVTCRRCQTCFDVSQE